MYVYYILEEYVICICATNNAQVVTSLLTSCNNLLQQADIRMCSHGLRPLVMTIINNCATQFSSYIFSVRFVRNSLLV